MRARHLLYALFLLGCSKSGTGPAEDFGTPARVRVDGYSGHFMEPFISRDGNVLFFNNLNAAPENTNIHWAQKLNDTVFQYKGEVAGVNTTALEGVPTQDNAGMLYFVSTRDYFTSLSTIFTGSYSNGTATSITQVPGISRLQPGWVNFDVEVSADGNTLYFVDGRYEQDIPVEADILVAEKTSSGFRPVTNAAALMKNVNTSALEYAAGISADELELYFTRWALPLSQNPEPAIYLSKRASKADPFGFPVKIASVVGFVEAPSVTPDGKGFYFHKKENGNFKLFLAKKRSP